MSVRLGGLQTLRYTILPGGNQDHNYLAFVKADVQDAPPSLASFSPVAGSTDWQRKAKATAVVKDGDSAKVVASSLTLNYDGADVTSSSTIADTAAGAEISYQPTASSAGGTTHTVIVHWVDDNGASGSGTWSYKEGIYDPVNNLFIEMEDFNTADGTYIPSTAGHPFAEKGQYNGLAATHDVDYHLQGSNPESPLYRAITPPNGITTINDANKGGAGPRPGFETVPDYKIGWTDGGDWFNYTRNYGAGAVYNVFLRGSHGDAAATIGGRLEQVDNATTATQNTTPLGNFKAPATGGWDTFTFIPLVNTDGELVEVTLQDVVTLRYTVQEGGDINYLMFCPVRLLNRCPSATGDSLAVAQGGTVNFQLQASDPDGNALAYSIAAAPAKGIVTVNTQTGAASYTPNAGACGTDSFTFTANDGKCTSASATVNVAIRDVTPPVITCPADLACVKATSNDGAVVNYLVSASDGCSLASLVCVPPPGSTFPVGSTMVTTTRLKISALPQNSLRASG